MLTPSAAQIADSVPIDGLVPRVYIFVSVDGVSPASLPNLYIVQPFCLRNSSILANTSMVTVYSLFVKKIQHFCECIEPHMY